MFSSAPRSFPQLYNKHHIPIPVGLLLIIIFNTILLKKLIILFNIILLKKIIIFNTILLKKIIIFTKL